MTVQVAPMPEYLRKVRPIYRHAPPPIYPDGPPTDADRSLARELFALLDDESREWYLAAGLRDLLAAALSNPKKDPLK